MPGRIILAAVFATIFCGTMLLMLPICHNGTLDILDAIFTATSATCVTGLLSIPLSEFTSVGQCIILLLLQVGGLGLITMSIFAMSIFVQLGLTTQLLAEQILELESWQNIKKLLFFIIKFTLSIELIGALFILFAIEHDFSAHGALFFAVFHSISSFCNAGFSLLPNSFVHYNTNTTLLITSALLMLTGGLGFITWHELFNYAHAYFSKKKFFLSLYTKIVLYVTFGILSISSVLFWLLERTNVLETLSSSDTILNIFFNTVASRSGGFTTVNLAELHTATLFLIMIVAFIGSSPGSTGSGIKTTTFAIFLATIRSVILGRNSVQIKKRKIARDQVNKALAIISLSFSWIIVATFGLLVSEPGFEFFDILFEVVSAFATLGLSTGITPNLSAIGKLLIVATMIIGRIGSLTVVLALKRKHMAQEFEYPEERVMLG